MANKEQTVSLGEGDNFQPVEVRLRKPVGRRALPWNLTGLTVQMAIANSANDQFVTAWTSTGVNVVEADEGRVQLSLPAEAVAVPAGSQQVERWVFLRIGNGSAWLTFPPDGCKLRLLISNVGG